MADVKKIQGYNIKDEEARNNISGLNNDVNIIKTSLITMNAELNNVKAKSNLNETRIESIDTEMNLSKQQRFIFIGDSYANPEQSWIERTAQYLGLTTNDYYKSHLSGACFTGGPNGTELKKFIDLLKDLDSIITNKESITGIVVCGGFNDRSSNNTIEPAISQFSEYAKTKYPNAIIYVGCIGWSTDGTYKWDNRFVLSCYKTCTKYGCRYLNNVEWTLRNGSLYLDDGVHPNEQGCIELGNNIANAILTGSCTVAYPLIGVHPDTSETLGTRHEDNAIYMMLNNECVQLIQNAHYYTFREIYTLKTSIKNSFKLGVIEKTSYIQGMIGTPIMIPIFCTFQNTGVNPVKTVYMQCVLCIKDCEVSIIPLSQSHEDVTFNALFINEWSHVVSAMIC